MPELLEFKLARPEKRTGQAQEAEDISWLSSLTGAVGCTACVLSHTTGQAEKAEDSWPSSPIGAVSCTAHVLSHRTGQAEEAEDISWPSSPIGTVSCTAFALSRREDGRKKEKEKEGRKVTDKNLTTTALTVGNEQRRCGQKLAVVNIVCRISTFQSLKCWYARIFWIV